MVAATRQQTTPRSMKVRVVEKGLVRCALMIQRTEPVVAQEWSDDDAVEELQDLPQETPSKKERNAARTEKLQHASNNLAAKRYCTSIDRT